MSDLLNTVLDAHGGLARWQEAHQITARQFFGGALWELKGHPGALNDVDVTVALDRQYVSQKPFFNPEHRTSFTADRVAVETSDGTVVEELTDPRASFAGHVLTTPWTRLQLAYFSGSAMWTYLAEPLSLTFPGVQTEEIASASENGRKFRRLRVTFPSSIATLSTEQVLYIGDDGSSTGATTAWTSPGAPLRRTTSPATSRCPGWSSPPRERSTPATSPATRSPSPWWFPCALRTSLSPDPQAVVGSRPLEAATTRKVFASVRTGPGGTHPDPGLHPWDGARP